MNFLPAMKTSDAVFSFNIKNPSVWTHHVLGRIVLVILENKVTVLCTVYKAIHPWMLYITLVTNKYLWMIKNVNRIILIQKKRVLWEHGRELKLLAWRTWKQKGKEIQREERKPTKLTKYLKDGDWHYDYQINEDLKKINKF